MSSPISIKTDQFEGPFSLLLELLTKRKLHIHDISLIEVTLPYFESVRALPHMPEEDLSYFLVLASTLVLMKARALVPHLDLSHTSEEEMVDEGSLTQLLLRYQAYAEQAKLLTPLMHRPKQYLFPLSIPKEHIPHFAPHPLMTCEVLHKEMLFIRTRYEEERKEEDAKSALPKRTISRTISLEMIMSDLKTLMAFEKQRSFFEVLNESSRTYEPQTPHDKKSLTVVHFLAVLQGVHAKEYELIQTELFGDIIISRVY
jgi:segregation and condensation protein A